jgi:hypothetical protein
MLTNADVGELLWIAGRDEPGHRGRATTLRRCPTPTRSVVITDHSPTLTIANGMPRAQAMPATVHDRS